MTNPSAPVDLLDFIDEVKKNKTEYDTIAKYTGVNFNIFNILDVSSKEVKLHSNFLAEMLNPKGSHMQGDTFLKLFLKEIEKEIKWKDRDNIGFEIQEAVVHKEFWTGEINRDYTKGGSIDILINNKHQVIIIENKIYAGDQPKQLKRYYKYGENEFKLESNFRILYLTLDCSEPSENSTDGIQHFSCISYKMHIKNWLEKCLTVVYDFPLVFALIRQYLNHVKHLTNQSIFKEMTKELKEKITNDPEAFKAAREISQALLTIRETLFKEITSYFFSYFDRFPKPQCILDLNIDIRLKNDNANGYRVGLFSNTVPNEGENYDYLKEIVNLAGGWNEDNQYLISWYKITCLINNLDCYADEVIIPLLKKDNLNKLYKEIDNEITGFLIRVTSGYINTI